MVAYKNKHFLNLILSIKHEKKKNFKIILYNKKMKKNIQKKKNNKILKRNINLWKIRIKINKKIKIIIMKYPVKILKTFQLK